MYAVAFDLVVADTRREHPKGVTQAYTEIGQRLNIGGSNQGDGKASMRANAHGL